jgi:hypothetical protein
VSSAFGTEDRNRGDGCVPAPFERRRFGVAVEIDRPAAVGLLPFRQPVEVAADGGLIEKGTDRAAGCGSVVQGVQRLTFGAAGDRERAVRGYEPSEASQKLDRFGAGVGGGVEESQREREDDEKGASSIAAIASKQ